MFKQWKPSKKVEECVSTYSELFENKWTGKGSGNGSGKGINSMSPDNVVQATLLERLDNSDNYGT